MLPKFKIGQKVQVVNDGEIGEILAFSYDSNLKAIRYTVSSKEVDLVKKEVIEGVKNCMESELKTVKSK